MKCPTCDNSDLVMSERLGVEIDYCPKCRGVWLDRGELDKIIERADSDDDDHRPVRREKFDEDRYRSEDSRQYKRKSFWSELFD